MRCAALLENPATDAKNAVKLHWLLSRIYRARGDADSELTELDYCLLSLQTGDRRYGEEIEISLKELSREKSCSYDPVFLHLPVKAPTGNAKQ